MPRYLFDTNILIYYFIRERKRIKLPDAIIAATAMEYSAILVTRNTKDFSSLGLTILNPFDNQI